MIANNTQKVNLNNEKIKEKEQKKMKNLELVMLYKQLYESEQLNISAQKIDRVENCSTYLEFLVNADKDKFRLIGGNTCRDRFCPACSKNLSTKNSIRIRAILNWIAKEHDKEFIFLTLTAPNIQRNELEEQVNRFNIALNRMFNRKEVKRINKGYVRKLEVTYNKKDNSYHPHFHLLIAVNKSYFTDKTYINRDTWLKMWRETMRDDKITQVDVRKAKNLDKAVLEISKYISKDNDYLINKDVFIAFYNALKGKRMVSFSGLFKKGMQLFKSGELDNYLDFSNENWKYFLSLLWKKKKYNIENFKEIDEQEINRYEFEIIKDIKKETPL